MPAQTDIRLTAARMLRSLHRHRERYVKAWLAATGLHPEDAMLVEQMLPADGKSIRMSVTVHRRERPAAGPWIAVTPETMPRDRSKVLVAFDGGGVDFAEWHEIEWESDGFYKGQPTITHWAAINEPETDAKGTG